jgi:hypothetical protein
MRFEFKPVRMRIDLREYNPELVAEEGIDPSIPVWVNVPRELFRRMLAAKGMPEGEFFELLSDLWTSPEAEWPVEDVRALYAHCKENDPQLWFWLTKKTFDVVFEYQAGQKKA